MERKRANPAEGIPESLSNLIGVVPVNNPSKLTAQTVIRPQVERFPDRCSYHSCSPIYSLTARDQQVSGEYAQLLHCSEYAGDAEWSCACEAGEEGIDGVR